MLSDDIVWVNHILDCFSLVKGLVSFRCFLQGDHFDVDHFRKINVAIQNEIQQSAIVSLDRALASHKRQGFGPTKTETKRQRTLLCGLIGTLQSGVNKRNSFFSFLFFSFLFLFLFFFFSFFFLSFSKPSWIGSHIETGNSNGS